VLPVLAVARLVVQLAEVAYVASKGGQLCFRKRMKGTKLTPIFSRSSSSSADVVEAIGGAAGNPTYLATPERIETSLLYAT
jgi:hypothetical protein